MRNVVLPSGAEGGAGSASYPEHAATPYSGFALAADAAVQHLHATYGMDVWLATHVEGDRQVVVAAAGPMAAVAHPGSVQSWPASFCLPMVRREGPTIALDVASVPVYAAAAVGMLAQVHAYVGMPLLRANGELFGTLCAFGTQPQPATLADAGPTVQLVARMLSTVLAREELAQDRQEEAARAYALAERDRLTGLRNRRGWEAALTQELDRCRRYGSAASVVVVDLDRLKHVNDSEGHARGDALLAACAGVLDSHCRPADVVARLGGDEFGVLAVECDSVGARALRVHLLTALRSAGIAASAGSATRRPGETLTDTLHRADTAMYRDKRLRRLSAPPVTELGARPA